MALVSSGGWTSIQCSSCSVSVWAPSMKTMWLYGSGGGYLLARPSLEYSVGAPTPAAGNTATTGGSNNNPRRARRRFFTVLPLSLLCARGDLSVARIECFLAFHPTIETVFPPVMAVAVPMLERVLDAVMKGWRALYATYPAVGSRYRR